MSIKVYGTPEPSLGLRDVEGPMRPRRLLCLLFLRPFDLLQRHQRRQLGLLPANGHNHDNNHNLNGETSVVVLAS